MSNQPTPTEDAILVYWDSLSNAYKHALEAINTAPGEYSKLVAAWANNRIWVIERPIR